MLLGMMAMPVHAQELKPVRTISVTGQAERKVAPDQANLQITVSASNSEIKAAKAEHDQKLQKALAIIKSAGIVEAKVSTGQSGIQPQFHDVEDPLPTNPNHRKQVKDSLVSTTLSITVQPLDKVGDLMEKLTAVIENKSDQNWNWQSSMSLNYGLSNSDKIRAEMAADAIKNARSKAEQMAGAAGSALGAVYQITEGNVPMFNQPVPMMAMAARAMDGAAMDKSIAPPAGEQQVTASVTVIYELK